MTMARNGELATWGSSFVLPAPDPLDQQHNLLIEQSTLVRTQFSEFRCALQQLHRLTSDLHSELEMEKKMRKEGEEQGNQRILLLQGCLDAELGARQALQQKVHDENQRSNSAVSRLEADGAQLRVDLHRLGNELHSRLDTEGATRQARDGEFLGIMRAELGRLEERCSASVTTAQRDLAALHENILVVIKRMQTDSADNLRIQRHLLDDKIISLEKELRKGASDLAEKHSSQSAASIQFQAEVHDGLCSEGARRREGEERLLKTLCQDIASLEARLAATISDTRDALVLRHDDTMVEARHQKEQIVTLELGLEELPKQFRREHQECHAEIDAVGKDVGALTSQLATEAQVLRGLKATVIAQCVSLEHVDSAVKGLSTSVVDGLRSQEESRKKAIDIKNNEIASLQSAMAAREMQANDTRHAMGLASSETKQRFAEVQVLLDVLEGRVGEGEQHLSHLDRRSDEIEHKKLDSLEGRVHELATLNSAAWTKIEVLDKHDLSEQVRKVEKLAETSEEHERALTGWEDLLLNTLPSRISTLETNCANIGRTSQDVANLKDAVLDLTAHSKHFLESHNGDFRLVLTPEGDVSVWRKGGKRREPQKGEDAGDAAFRTLCWHAGVSGTKAQCSMNRELTTRETDRLLIETPV